MKIIYEIGDTAHVEDNVKAGELAACDVELIKKEGTKWYCENLDSWKQESEYGWVEEYWLSPR